MKELYSIEAEQSVIGAILLDNNAFDLACDLINHTDFSVIEYQVIYKHIALMLEARRPVDVTTLTAELEQRERVPPKETYTALLTMLQAVPTALHTRHYAQIIRDRRLERDLHRASQQMGELAFGIEPVADRLERAQELVMALSETQAKDAIAVADEVDGVIELFERRMELKASVTGVASGLADFDDMTYGFQPGDLIYLAGRPGMGKTALVGQIALHGAIPSPVQMFSMEMASGQLTERLVCNIARVDAHAVRGGRFGQGDWERISLATGIIKQRQLYIDDTPAMRVGMMRARCRRMKRTLGLGMVVVDYIQLMSHDGTKSRNEDLTEISRGLKLLAREMECPVLCISALSRKCEDRADKRPILSDLRDSGALEQDADVVAMLYREEVYNPDDDRYRNVAELIVRKNRSGPLGTVYLSFHGEHSWFGNLTGWTRPPELREPRHPHLRSLS